MKRILLIALLAVSALTLSGCNTEYESKASYFNGTILAEYHQTRTRGSDDTFTFTFYEPGTYNVTFSAIPGESSRGQEYRPQGFETTIEQAPRVRVINQYILPDFLRVTITHNGVSETHDFK